MRSARATTRASSGVGTSSRRVLHSARAPCSWKARRYRLAKSSGGDGSVFRGLPFLSGWCKTPFIVRAFTSQFKTYPIGVFSREANPGTDSQFPAKCAGNLVSVPGLLKRLSARVDYGVQSVLI